MDAKTVASPLPCHDNAKAPAPAWSTVKAETVAGRSPVEPGPRDPNPIAASLDPTAATAVLDPNPNAAMASVDTSPSAAVRFIESPLWSVDDVTRPHCAPVGESDVQHFR
ncbi:hypothetical protein [Speluncibacter jeojiensis]|uniref:Uncharacterized protein n=1 Tax=Speluncibacter jeojiensis TaxID=2710754 RepID=A0A9X4RFM0_9ACTN|nr:hypothetical protein [Corynebacteriales bacterium D3-21]